MRRLIIFLFVLQGCYTSANTGYEDDATDDSRPETAGDAEAEEPGGEFCTGPAKVELDHRMVQPIAVTTSEIVMSCCWGVLLKFHTQDTLGHSIIASIVEFVGMSDDWPAVTVDGGIPPIEGGLFDALLALTSIAKPGSEALNSPSLTEIWMLA